MTDAKPKVVQFVHPGFKYHKSAHVGPRSQPSGVNAVEGRRLDPRSKVHVGQGLRGEPFLRRGSSGCPTDLLGRVGGALGVLEDRFSGQAAP